MDHHELSRQIMRMNERVADLRRKAVLDRTRPEFLQEVVSQLDATVDELATANEELEAQNLELATIHAEAERERQRYRRLFTSAPAAYVLTSLIGVISEVNRAAAGLFGGAPAVLGGKPLSLFVVPEDRGKFQELVRRLRTGESTEVADTIRMRPLPWDHTFFCHVRATAELDANARVQGCLWVLEDTSTEQRAKMADQLSEDARRKDEFLALLAHELRNPLAPVRAAVDVWRRQGDALTHDERSWMIEVVRRQADHLAYLMDDLLDVSRVSHGRIPLRRTAVDLRDAVTQAHDAVRWSAQLHDVIIETPTCPVAVHGDPARLRQVIVNLMDNALKYTPKGGHVRVRVDVEDEEARLTVSDDGVGLAPETRESIFLLFNQDSQSLARSQGGLGLGLALVRRLVELHGGTVSAHSEGLGRGSCFEVRLPRIEVEEAPRPALTESQLMRLRPLRVLIADDNVDAAEMLAMLLQASGHETALAFDGMSALEAFEKVRPDVVLLDLGLPDLDGFEVAAHLRTRGRAVPIVAVTGYGDEIMRARTRESGFAGHLLKPVDYESLRRVLETAVPLTRGNRP